jgi:AcrR family transcriptional regulator
MRAMSKKTRPPEDLEAAANDLSLSMNEVCRRAQVARSTFTRWKAKERSIRVDSYDRLWSVIEEEQETRRQMVAD